MALRTLIADVETNGLLDRLDRVHCLSIKEFESGKKFSFHRNEEEDNIAEGLDLLSNARRVVFHNGLPFDIEAIQQVYPDFHIKGRISDTLVLSRLLMPQIESDDYRLFDNGKIPGELIGRHGLEAWGYRLNKHKGDYMKEMEAEAKAKGIVDDDEIIEYVWGKWNQHMEDYCENDVEVTSLLWKELLDRFETWSPESIILEHEVADLIVRMEGNGFPFNIEEANAMVEEMTDMISPLEDECHALFPGRFVPDKKYTDKPREEYGEKRYKSWAKRGRWWAEVTVPKRTLNYKDVTKASRVEGAAYSKVKWKDFNPTSRTQVAERLIEMGWKPDEFTEKGNPKVNDKTLRRAADQIPIAKSLADLFLIKKRLSQLADGDQAWLKCVADDGMIYGGINSHGAVTGRATHFKPNMAQVPKVKKKKGVGILRGFEGAWGYESRNLFYVPEPFVLMGCDLSGIELRCLAHYMAEFDGGEYGRELLEGDIHTVTQNGLGLETRDMAKTVIYACVTMDSKALTAEGWKSYEELSVGELVLTYNQKDNVKEWQPILDKVKYEDAEVVEMSHSHSFSIKSTPNHRWFVRQRRDRKSHKGRYMEPMIRTTEEINTESNIICNAPLRENRELNNFKLTDINDFPKYSTDWVSEVLKMDQHQLEAFLSGFLLADGHYVKSNNSWRWNQNIGDIQEAALLATYLCHKGYIYVNDRTDAHSPMVVVRLSKKQHITGQKLKKKRLKNQPVWCIKTKNESWVVRQGNTITITGNTLYGGGNQKIGSIVAPEASIIQQEAIGADIKKRLMKTFPALKSLIRNIRRQAKRGWIEGLDGRKLFVRHQHAALNTLLQAAGAILAKKWIVTFEEYMEDEGFIHSWEGDFAMLAWIHDEIQNAVNKEIAVQSGELAVKAALDAGDMMGFRLPMDAEYGLGQTWAETH